MLTGDLVRLRPLEPEDADALYRWHNDDEVMRWLQSYFHESLAGLRRRLADRQENSHEKVALCIETLEERKAIGIVALREADPINARAIRSYEKVRFQVDGRFRQSFFRDGKWHDALLMCVLKDELR